MEYLATALALLVGLALGFVIGKLTGSRAGIAAETENRGLKDRLTKLETEQGALTQKFQDEFSRIANAVLKDGLQTVTTTAQTNLATLLNPLQNKLGEFQNRLEQNVTAQGRDSAALKEQIRALTDLNKNLGDDTKRLTSALKGDVKQQGNWGELKLKRLLEASELKEGLEFRMQVSLTNDENSRFQPDAIIYLPEKRHVVIDAKVTLPAYERLFEDGIDREATLNAIVASVRAHLKGLADRDYAKLTGLNTPDMVFMFMPIEGTFLTALGQAPEIYEEAYRKKIILLGPSTLLAALKLVQHMWRQEEQSKNAQEIARQGAALYDKFASFVEDLQKIDKKLGEARDAYSDAYGKLKGGKGNLIGAASRLKELGVQPKKQITVADDSNE